jgi:metallo-beta-lactamase family protein
MKLSFCGAAKIVTGSCFLVETQKSKVLVDCGMFQGGKDITKLNYGPFFFDPRKISHLILTHAHIDHSGLIPKLVKGGFKGEIIATSPTVDLCGIMLKDCAHVMLQDTLHENRRRQRLGLALREPLYSEEDADKCLPFFRKVDYGIPVQITEDLKFVFSDAGHIIGSSIVELFVEERNKVKKIVFSGDLGQWDVPIVNNPTLIEGADFVLIESTYGDRLHERHGLRDDLLLEQVKKTFDKKGKLLIPSFAVERTQELLYAFKSLIDQGKFPYEKVFLDSPLAIKATEIFKRHRKFFDEEALKKYKDPFTFPTLVYCSKTEDSVKLNDYEKPCIIIAGSGMCTGGRIRQHLKHGLWNPKNTVLFVGFQAEGTLGRYILEGAKKIKMMGMDIVVKASVAKINSFSAHADYEDILRWVDGFKVKPKKFFIVHGEEKAAKSLKNRLEKKGCECYIPGLRESVQI